MKNLIKHYNKQVTVLKVTLFVQILVQIISTLGAFTLLALMLYLMYTSYLINFFGYSFIFLSFSSLIWLLISFFVVIFVVNNIKDYKRDYNLEAENNLDFLETRIKEFKI